MTYIPQYVTGTHVASRSWAEANRNQFVRLLKAMIETGDWLKDPANEKAVVQWFADNVAACGPDKLEPQFAQKMYDFYIKDKRLSFDGYAPESAARANIESSKRGAISRTSEVPPARAGLRLLAYFEFRRCANSAGPRSPSTGKQ